MPRREWDEVTPRRPCPVCGRDGWCAVSRDGTVAVCRRVPDGGRARVDRAGVPYFVHRPRDRDPTPIGVVIARRVEALTGGVPDPAPVEVRDAVYRALLARLPLDATHREALLRRGMPDEEITRRGYGSLPPPGPPWTRESVARDLMERFGVGVLSVPGIVRRVSKRTGRVYMTVAGPPGLLVPVRDVDGRIVALLVRPDTSADGSKYRWVTSRGAGGPGPGTPAHVPLPAPGGPPARGGTVAVYEGILKSDISAALDPARLPAVGIPGHAGWRAALPILRSMGPRTVRYFPDPDAWIRPEVAASLRAF